jgi:hypothetical protein
MLRSLDCAQPDQGCHNHDRHGFDAAGPASDGPIDGEEKPNGPMPGGGGKPRGPFGPLARRKRNGVRRHAGRPEPFKPPDDLVMGGYGGDGMDMGGYGCDDMSRPGNYQPGPGAGEIGPQHGDAGPHAVSDSGTPDHSAIDDAGPAGATPCPLPLPKKMGPGGKRADGKPRPRPMQVGPRPGHEEQDGDMFGDGMSPSGMGLYGGSLPPCSMPGCNMPNDIMGPGGKWPDDAAGPMQFPDPELADAPVSERGHGDDGPASSVRPRLSDTLPPHVDKAAAGGP